LGHIGRSNRRVTMPATLTRTHSECRKQPTNCIDIGIAVPIAWSVQIGHWDPSLELAPEKCTTRKESSDARNDQPIKLVEMSNLQLPRWNKAHIRMFVQRAAQLERDETAEKPMRIPKLLRTTALAGGLVAAAVPALSVPAEAAWWGHHGGWHGGWGHGGWGWGGVGLGLAAGALVGAALTAPYYGYGYGYGYPAYGYGYGYPAYAYDDYDYGYPGYGYGYGYAAPAVGYGYGGYWPHRHFGGYAYRPHVYGHAHTYAAGYGYRHRH
jgi:hypothetical protein